MWPGNVGFPWESLSKYVEHSGFRIVKCGWHARGDGGFVWLDTYFMCYEPCYIQTLRVIEHYHYYERFVFAVNIKAKTFVVSCWDPHFAAALRLRD